MRNSKLPRTSRKADVFKEEQVNHSNIAAAATSNKADTAVIPVHSSASPNSVYDIVDSAALQQASNSTPQKVYRGVATHLSSTVFNKIISNRPTNVTSPTFVEDSVIEAGNHDADADIPRLVGSNRMVSSTRFKPSIKLSARMEKLVRKRIDPSSITFPEGARQFHGGHATVSEARLKAQEMGGRGTIRDEEVAVKKMRLADDTDLERALGLAIREAELLAELYYPNIVKFSGFVEDVSNSILWLVFPWAHNGTLKDFISSINWEIPERISLINDVTQGLEYLHSRKPPICHGDLKSGDSKTSMELVESEARDRSVQPLTTTFCASTNTITLTGNKYTLRWAAPELLNEDQLSLWSDIWALGWIAYEVTPPNQI
ncbi:hypothetical protein FRC00_013563 [Tulasnella sp. 408]|nr:hypothetical protein FRC00_013563 [Tulasnella sp. 408]